MKPAGAFRAARVRFFGAAALDRQGIDRNGGFDMVFYFSGTGNSKYAAQRIAEKLRSLAKHKQVLCVTHLPQLAALADTHLLISKAERDGRTYTSVTPLDKEGRKRELARIIGGTHITETTLKSAEEMLVSSGGE